MDALETTLPTETKLKTVSVKLSRQVDLGYVPYIHYIKALNGKAVPFGTRDQSRAEFDVFVSVEVGTDDNLEQIVMDLSREAHGLADRILREQYATAFLQAAAVEAPEEAFTISKTVVQSPAAEY